jgi:hypothetical protein
MARKPVVTTAKTFPSSSHDRGPRHKKIVIILLRFYIIAIFAGASRSSCIFFNVIAAASGRSHRQLIRKAASSSCSWLHPISPIAAPERSSPAAGQGAAEREKRDHRWGELSGARHANAAAELTDASHRLPWRLLACPYYPADGRVAARCCDSLNAYVDDIDFVSHFQ